MLARQTGNGEITEAKYYLKEIIFPMNPIDLDNEYTVTKNMKENLAYGNESTSNYEIIGYII